MILSYIVGVVLFMALDFLWLGMVMSGFYKQELGAHVAVVNGSLHIQYVPAILFYLIATGGLLFFVFGGEATTFPRAAFLGAFLGFLIYASYDLTNAATLTNYSWRLVFADAAWGTVAMGIVAAVMNTVLQWLA